MAPQASSSSSSLTNYRFFRNSAKCRKWIEIAFWVLILSLLTFSNSVSSSQATVKSLPGFPGDLPFLLETGYIGVGEEEEIQLFYYFIESEDDPEKDPLILWLPGGPGCSSLYSLMYGIGPIGFDYKKSYWATKPVLELQDFSWTLVANIIFLDAPVGTGFSYATTSEAYKTSDTKSTANIYEFLIKWILAHPKFQSNRLYIAGDSHSGITIPALVKRISDGQQTGSTPGINLKGYIIGNPFTDAKYDINARIKFAHRNGLLSDEIYEATKRDCHGDYIHINTSNTACLKDFEIVNQCLKDLYYPMILEPKCKTFYSYPNMSKWSLNPLGPMFRDEFLSEVNPIGEWCRNDNYLFVKIWANDKEVQEALHVRNGTIKEWKRCNTNLSYTFDIPSSIEYYRSLLEKDMQVLLYSGDRDMITPYLGTEDWIPTLNLSVASGFEWRPWFVDVQTAGYTVIFTNYDYVLTFTTVKGAGHTAPEYKPKECFNMINRWLAYYML